MLVGDIIALEVHVMGKPTGEWQEFVVEEFRDCLGVFLSDQHRTAGRFVPLCDLYQPGLKSEEKYIPNFGSYYTNMVPQWQNPAIIEELAARKG